MKTTILNRLQQSIDTKQRLLADPKVVEVIEAVATHIIERIQAGNTIYFAGNGGSAADAQHLSAELSGRFYFDRDPLSAEALHCNTSFLTAVANDYSFDLVYARLLKGIAKKGDVIVGLSTSGNSKNIVNAFEIAKQIGVSSIAFTGESGGKMKEIADHCICIPSSDTPRIQECHITVGHIVCEIIEAQLFGNKH